MATAPTPSGEPAPHTYTFPVGQPDRHAGPSLSRQPVEVCHFSYDDKRRIHHDDRSLAYFWPAPERADLAAGFNNRYVRRDESIDEHLDGLLAAIVHFEADAERSAFGGVDPAAKTRQVDIITWRGIVTRMLTLPYDACRPARFQDGFALNVVRLGDTVFIEDHTTQELRQDKQRREVDLRQQAAMHWGYRYEALSTIPAPWPHVSREAIDGRQAEAVVDTNVQYVSVVRTRLGPVSLVLGGEVDCVLDYLPDPEPPVDVASFEPADADHTKAMRLSGKQYPGEDRSARYVELKTSKTPASARDVETFERVKLLKFWAQSFLLGVPHVRVGFRDDVGVLQTEQQLSTLAIPAIVRDKGRNTGGYWDGNVCINFAGSLLEFIKATALSEQEGVWRVHYRPGSGHVEMSQVESRGHGFITPEFLRHRGFDTLK